MKTYSAKPTDVTRAWYVLDATETPLGRLATVAASLLLGKGKPGFSHHIDVGDYVIVINSDNLVVTGGKETKKTYYRHTGFPGGIKERSLADEKALDSTAVIHKAVRGMLPVNKLRPERLRRLKIFIGQDHQHAPQNPVKYSLKKESK